MNIFQLSEKQKKTLGFGMITLAWIMGIFLVVENYADRKNVNTESRLRNLSRADARLEEQENLIGEMNELYEEIRIARFEVYQDYHFEYLLNRIKELLDEKSPNIEYRKQGAEVLKLLLFARQEMIKKEGNLIKTELDVKNCRDGLIVAETE